MSTRSVTRIMEDGKELVCIYRQCDGYPTGMGADLKRTLKGYKIVNGISGEDNCAKCNEPKHRHSAKRSGMNKQSHRFIPQRAANGMACLAASLVRGLKDGIGNVYLYPAGTKDAGQKYEYTLWVEVNKGGDMYVSEYGPLMLKVSIPEFNDADEKVSEKVLWSGALDKYTPRDNNEL